MEDKKTPAWLPFTRQHFYLKGATICIYQSVDAIGFPRSSEKLLKANENVKEIFQEQYLLQ